MNVKRFSVSVRSRFGLHSASFLKRFFENHLSASGFQETTCQPVVSLKTTCQQVVFRIWAMGLRVEDLMIRAKLLR